MEKRTHGYSGGGRTADRRRLRSVNHAQYARATAHSNTWLSMATVEAALPLTVAESHKSAVTVLPIPRVGSMHCIHCPAGRSQSLMGPCS